MPCIWYTSFLHNKTTRMRSSGSCPVFPGTVDKSNIAKRKVQTYNIHHRQDVVLDVFAPVVSHHHFIGDHECLHKALAAHGAPLPAGAARGLAVILGRRRRLDRRRRADRAGRLAFIEVCSQGEATLSCPRPYFHCIVSSNVPLPVRRMHMHSICPSEPSS